MQSSTSRLLYHHGFCFWLVVIRRMTLYIGKLWDYFTRIERQDVSPFEWNAGNIKTVNTQAGSLLPENRSIAVRVKPKFDF